MVSTNFVTTLDGRIFDERATTNQIKSPHHTDCATTSITSMFVLATNGLLADLASLAVGYKL